mgnify:CR=1 FL=1
MSVIVYSTPTCAYCHALKQFLFENNIAFEDIDAASDEIKTKELLQNSGQMEGPVIDIHGEIIVGIDKEKIKKLLNINE